MDRKERRVALLRVHEALAGAPEPNRALRRAAAAGARKAGRKKQRRG